MLGQFSTLNTYEHIDKFDYSHWFCVIFALIRTCALIQRSSGSETSKWWTTAVWKCRKTNMVRNINTISANSNLNWYFKWPNDYIIWREWHNEEKVEVLTSICRETRKSTRLGAEAASWWCQGDVCLLGFWEFDGDEGWSAGEGARRGAAPTARAGNTLVSLLQHTDGHTCSSGTRIPAGILSHSYKTGCIQHFSLFLRWWYCRISRCSMLPPAKRQGSN